MSASAVESPATRRERTGTVTSLLLIEDDPEDEILVRATFPEWTSITCARNLEDAAELLRGAGDAASDIEIVLLDLSLPGVRGVETVRAAVELAPDLPIVVLTGVSDIEVATAAIAAGAQDFVPKNDLVAMPWARLQRVMRYAVERHGLMRELDEAKQRQVEAAHVQRLEAMGRLAAGIAHELNTPLQFVSDNVRFVADCLNDLMPLLQGLGAPGGLGPDVAAHRDDLDLAFFIEEAPGALRDALDGLGRMARLVAAVKEFAHPGTGEKRPLDLNHLVSSTVTVSRNEWKYVAEVAVALEAGLPRIEGEHDKLAQVLLNLIVNSAQAIGAANPPDRPGHIVITTRTDDDTVVLDIADDGPGIPADIIDKIWDPFFTTKEVGTGSGQGLAIARSILVEAHDATINVSSDSSGTRFTIRFPAAQSSEEHA